MEECGARHVGRGLWAEERRSKNAAAKKVATTKVAAMKVAATKVAAKKVAAKKVVAKKVEREMLGVDYRWKSAGRRSSHSLYLSHSLSLSLSLSLSPLSPFFSRCSHSLSFSLSLFSRSLLSISLSDSLSFSLSLLSLCLSLFSLSLSLSPSSSFSLSRFLGFALFSLAQFSLSLSLSLFSLSVSLSRSQLSAKRCCIFSTPVALPVEEKEKFVREEDDRVAKETSEFEAAKREFKASILRLAEYKDASKLNKCTILQSSLDRHLSKNHSKLVLPFPYTGPD
jgi:hypothetical protein